MYIISMLLDQKISILGEKYLNLNIEMNNPHLRLKIVILS